MSPKDKAEVEKKYYKTINNNTESAQKGQNVRRDIYATAAVVGAATGGF